MRKMDLLWILANKVHGCKFVGIDTRTVPVLLGGKKNPFQNRVVKFCEGSNVMLFSNTNCSGYENMVKRRLEQEGMDPESFVMKDRQWGGRVPQTSFVEHKGKYYLDTIFKLAGKVWYEVDGIETHKSQIQGLNLSKSEGEQGGLSKDNKVIIRTFKIESIMRITVDHETFKSPMEGIEQIGMPVAFAG